MVDPPGRHAINCLSRGAARQYAVLSTAAIMRSRLPPIADQAVLFLPCLVSVGAYV